MQDTDSLRNDLLSQIAAASDAAALEQIRVAALGKKGAISELMPVLPLSTRLKVEGDTPSFTASCLPVMWKGSR